MGGSSGGACQAPLSLRGVNARLHINAKFRLRLRTVARCSTPIRLVRDAGRHSLEFAESDKGLAAPRISTTITNVLFRQTLLDGALKASLRLGQAHPASKLSEGSPSARAWATAWNEMAWVLAGGLE